MEPKLSVAHARYGDPQQDCGACQVHTARARSGRNTRALDRERVRRIEIMNAYLPVAENQEIVLVCSDCGEAATTQGESIIDTLRDMAVAKGFLPSRIIIEAEGQCHPCVTALKALAARPESPRHHSVAASLSQDHA